MSRPAAVVTDTTHYLPRELVDANDLHQVSLYVNWKGDTDKEADLPGFDGYYDHLRTGEELPTTSQPSVGDFVGVYEPLLADGRDVVSVHLSAGLSGTCESAQQAKARLEEEGKGGERIVIVDSESACGGEGFIVLAAAAAARKGLAGKEVAAHCAEARKQLKMWFAVDTMEFLRRGGRVGAARAWLGSTLKIKPILTVESEITPIERVRTSRRAFERMVEYMRSRHDDGADAWVVQHIQAPDEAAELVQRGREVYGTEPAFISEVGPVIGTHVGPGLLGCGGLPPRYLD
ncbi:MAG TPA: DegV family protein [Solirubrobacteraceae bacterium]|nr:DegV family protein [Solirubrobacteraceae bacterium]